MTKLVKPPKPKQHVMALRLKSKDQLMLDELARMLNAPKAIVMRMALKRMWQDIKGGVDVSGTEVESDEE